MVRPLKIHGTLAMTGTGSGVDNLELEEIAGDPQTPNISQVWYNLNKTRVGYCEAFNNKIPVIRYLAHLDDLTTINSSITTLTGAVQSVSAQIKQLAKYRGNVAPVTGATLYPLGTAKPLITGGTELWSLSVTPNAVGSNILVRFSGYVDANKAASKVTIAIFRDSVYLCSQTVQCGSNVPASFSIDVNDVTTAKTAVKYSARIGVSATANWYLGQLAGYTMGGGNPSFWSITEELN